MESDVARNKELGRELARVRDLAGLTQAQLAERLSMSQTVVSRSESGERRLKSAELKRLAEAIGTEEARGLETRRSRQWKALKRPPLGHPDHDLLWKAELVLRELETLGEKPDIAQAFARRIRVFCEEIKTAVEKLLRRTCSVVFIGKIGVGKDIGDLPHRRSRGPPVLARHGGSRARRGSWKNDSVRGTSQNRADQYRDRPPARTRRSVTMWRNSRKRYLVRPREKATKEPHKAVRSCHGRSSV